MTDSLRDRLTDALTYQQGWTAHDHADAVLPIVKAYAEERVVERLAQAALHFDGYTERVEIALGGQRYVVTTLQDFAANPSKLDACNCPDRHCDECGCCP